MEKRLLLAVLLMSAVIMITNLLFPPATPPEELAPEAADAPVAVAPAPAAAPIVAPLPGVGVAARADTVVVTSPLYRYAFSTQGAALVGAQLLEYPSYIEAGSAVQLVPAGATDFLAHQVVVGGDTLDLRRIPFQASAEGLALDEESGPRQLTFRYEQPGGLAIEIGYTFSADRYIVGVEGRVSGTGGRAGTLLTEIGPAIASHEDPQHRSEAELAVIAGGSDGVETLLLRKVGLNDSIPGAYSWAGIKDKYFLAAIIADGEQRISGIVARDLPDEFIMAGGDSVVLPRAEARVALPIAADGSFAFEMYLGPQEHERLVAAGHDLQEVNPFGYRWLRPVIRPIAAAVLWLLEVMHNTLGIAYGWVLVLFGVLMKVILWPLNSKAQRAQLKNMGVQPLMQEIREKYKDNPQKQQEEILRLYKEHGFNPLAGCLPMLIPFPVLITLFFVFQGTIAFRGADFLWLPDLSLPDPFYLLPVLLVVSMFAMQWITAHLSGMEQNPQMKMMMYFMPLFMGFIFFRFASGLNLYYVVSNIAGIPQQIMIAKERRQAQTALKSEQAASPPSPKPKRAGGRRKRKAGGRG